ncbi:unnamed protein product [Gadus morhua 'NCC']
MERRNTYYVKKPVEKGADLRAKACGRMFQPGSSDPASTLLLKHLLQREFKNKDTKHLSRKLTEWAYGPISCSLYDLEALDTYGDKGSILELVVHGSDNPQRRFD